MGAFASIGIGLAARFLISLLTPSKVTDVGKLDDTSTQKSQFGASIPVHYGKYREEGLNVFWSPKLFVKTKKEKQGGKGGGSAPTTRTYHYSASFAVLVSDTRVAAFLRVWVNGKVEYNIGHKAVEEDIARSTEYAKKYLRFFHGQQNMTQAPDLVAVEGNDIPAFRRKSYLLFERLPLEKYGNRIPKIDCEVQGTPWRYIHGICESAELKGSDLLLRYSKFSLNDKTITFKSPVLNPTDLKKDPDGLTGFVGDQTVLIAANDVNDPCCPVNFAVNTYKPHLLVQIYSTNNSATLKIECQSYKEYGVNQFPPSYNNIQPVFEWVTLTGSITTVNYNPSSLQVLGVIDGSRIDGEYKIIIKTALIKDCADNIVWQATYIDGAVEVGLVGKILRVDWFLNNQGAAQASVVYTTDGITEQRFPIPQIIVPNIPGIANKEINCQQGYLLQTKSIITYRIESAAIPNQAQPDFSLNGSTSKVICATTADTSITINSVSLVAKAALPDNPVVRDAASNYPVDLIPNPFGITHHFAPNSKFAGYELEVRPDTDYDNPPSRVFLHIKQENLATKEVTDLVELQVTDYVFYYVEDFFKPYLKQAVVDFDLVSQGGGLCELVTGDEDCDTLSCGLNKKSLYVDHYINIRYIIRDLCRRAGLKDTDYDVCRLNHHIIGARLPQNDETFKSLIEELQKIFFFIIRFRDGKISFVPQTNVCSDYQTITITIGDLGSREITEDIPDYYEILAAQANDLPTSVLINYKNGENNHQPGSQQVMRDFADHVNSLQIDSPLVLSDGLAKDAAWMTLRQSWTQRTRYNKLVLLPRWITSVESGTHLIAPINDVATRMQVGKRSIGGNYLLEIETVYLDQTSLEQPPSVSDIFSDSSIVFANSLATPLLLDINCVSDGDSDSGVYIGATAPNGEWNNGSVLVSEAGQNNYDELVFLLGETIAGKVLNTLPSHTPYIVDYNNEIKVILDEGSLAGSTPSEFAQLKQIALVGKEIIGFKSALLVATDTYELRGLQRGLYGTEWAIDTHQLNERFILLRDEGLTERAAIATTHIGNQFQFKCLASDQALEDAPAYTYTYQGNSLKPYSPVQPSILATSSAYHFRIVRRTRKTGHWGQTSLTPPINEAFLKFEWDFYQGNNIVATKTTNTEELIYPLADIINDYGSTPNNFTFKVYQISQAVGRGYPLNVNSLAVLQATP